MKSSLAISIVVACPLAALAGPDPALLLAHAKEASGGKSWDSVKTLHTNGHVATGGLDGPFEAWDDVLAGRYVEKFTLGPVTGAEGFDGKTSWEQDASGQIKSRDSEEARQDTVNGIYERVMGYWFPDRIAAEIVYKERRDEGTRSFDVLSITPKGGRAFEMWLDEKSGLLDRTIDKGALETRTSFVSDYRRVEGLLLPFKERTTTGDPKYDVLGEVRSVEVNAAIDEAVFAVPGPPPRDFSIAGGAISTTVPFELLNNHIYVDVTLNGKGPYRLLCDTGGSNVVTPDLAKELGLQAQGSFEGKGVGEKSEEVSVMQVASLGLGEATVRNQLFSVFPLEGLDKVEGVPEHGIIGYEVFKRFVVRIDYGKSKLTLTLPEAYKEAGGISVPFEFHGQTPQVDGEIDGIKGKFTIDTGSRASLDLHVPFVEKNDLRTRYAPKVEGVTGWGVGGAARSAVTRAGLLRLGGINGVSVKEPVTELSMQKSGAFTDPYLAGNVGAGILQRFDLTFDYGRKRILFEPNGHDAHDSFDRAGLWMNLGSDGFEVVDVFAGGPAAEAGLVKGDVIVSIDGSTPEKLPLPAARRKLRTDPPGSKVHLSVRSAGKTRDVTVTLRDLV